MITPHWDPSNAGVALCPEDRKAAGIVDDLTVRENIILAMQANKGWFRYLNLQKQYEIAEKYIRIAEYLHPICRSAGEKPERRQSAKSDPGPVAGNQSPGAHPG